MSLVMILLALGPVPVDLPVLDTAWSTVLFLVPGTSYAAGLGHGEARGLGWWHPLPTTHQLPCAPGVYRCAQVYTSAHRCTQVCPGVSVHALCVYRMAQIFTPVPPVYPTPGAWPKVGDFSVSWGQVLSGKIHV